MYRQGAEVDRWGATRGQRGRPPRENSDSLVLELLANEQSGLASAVGDS